MSYPNNQERTRSYLENFNREEVLKLLINSKKPIILDVGANNGSSLIEFKNLWPESIVHCFEPQSICWKVLEEKAKKYSIDSVFINKFALGNKVLKKKEFYSHDISTGISGFHKINLNSKDSINIKNIKKNEKSLEEYKNTINHTNLVELKRLDDYIIENNLKKIDLLKMDTQGYEPQILEGLSNQLSKINLIITEIMFYDFYEKNISFYEIEKHLIPYGFKLYDISHISKNPLNGRTDWVDVIYINEEFNSI